RDAARRAQGGRQRGREEGARGERRHGRGDAPCRRRVTCRSEPDQHPRAPGSGGRRRRAGRLRPRPPLRRAAAAGRPAAQSAAARPLARQARSPGCAGGTRRRARLPRRLRRGGWGAMRLLIVLTGAIGDVVRALPLLGRVRRARPESWIGWVVEPPAAPLLVGHPWLDEVLVFDRPAGLRAIPSLLARLRARRYDVALDLGRSAKTALFTRLAGAPLRLGFDRRDGREGSWLAANR